MLDLICMGSDELRGTLNPLMDTNFSLCNFCLLCVTCESSWSKQYKSSMHCPEVKGAYRHKILNKIIVEFK